MTVIKETIVVFDFDGTITKKDSFNDLLITNFGLPRFLVIYLFLTPLILLYKIGLISNRISQEIIFSYFFKNMNLDEFNKICTNYSRKYLPKIIKKPAIEIIKKYKKNGFKVVIVSASFSNWIKRWAKEYKIDALLTSELEIIDSKITGRFKDYCNDRRKATKFLQFFPNRNKYRLIAYGNSSNDKELFKISDQFYYRNIKN